MSFSEWLVENDYVSSTDEFRIQSELSPVELDTLYYMYEMECYGLSDINETEA